MGAPGEAPLSTVHTGDAAQGRPQTSQDFLQKAEKYVLLQLFWDLLWMSVVLTAVVAVAGARGAVSPAQSRGTSAVGDATETGLCLSNTRRPSQSLELHRRRQDSAASVASSEHGERVGGNEMALSWFQRPDVRCLGHRLFARAKNSSAAFLSVQ